MDNIRYITVEPHYSPKKIVELLCKQLKISSLADKLGLCLCGSDGEENILPDATLITDIMIDIEKKQVL